MEGALRKLMNNVHIQIQDVSGNWLTVSSTENQAQIFSIRLTEAARNYRRRSRAIDARTGIVLDIR